MCGKPLTFTVALIAVAAACAATGAAGNGGPAPAPAQGWDGVAERSGTSRYVALTQGATTVVASVRTRGGRVERWNWLKGAWGIPVGAFNAPPEGLSRDGRTLVLAGVETIRPETRLSRFAVLGTKQLRLRKLVTLRGAFAYDALSPDARTLYLIHYQPSTADVRYHVRAYDLDAGRLEPDAIVDPREADEAMQGSPMSRATSPNGAWVFTLYSRPGEPFVHALDTVNRAAVCIDLPWKNVDDAIFNVRLRLDRDGRLVLRQGKVRLAVVDTRTWKVWAFRKPVAP